MQSDSQLPEPAQPDAAAPLFSPRRLAWLVGALLLAIILVGALWAVRTWQTNRAIANVESSLAGRPVPAGVAAPAGAAAAAAAAPKAVPEEGGGPPAVSSSSDRLPPLMLSGQPVPAAVLRDLPEWVVAEVAPAQTSGASGDESAAPTAAAPAAPASVSSAPAIPLAQGRQRAEAAPQRERKDQYGSVFARCPGPGQSGAVECRRAVCAGAARKAASCAPYRD